MCKIELLQTCPAMHYVLSRGGGGAVEYKTLSMCDYNFQNTT